MRKSSVDPHLPEDCALLLGLPPKLERFRRQAKDSHRDFARSAYRELGAEAERTYARTLATLDRILSEAREMGVCVVMEAGLPQLRWAVERYAVVSVIGHFASVEITAEDIIDPHGLLQRWHTPQTTTDFLMRHRIQKTTPGLLAPAQLKRSPAQNAISIADQLQYAVEQSLAEVESGNSHNETGDSWAQLHRPVLEEAYAGLLKTSPGVELADGLCTVPEFIDAIPADFSGVLDLGLCNALSFGNILRRHRSGCLIWAGRERERLWILLTIYILAIQELQVNVEFAPISFPMALEAVLNGIAEVGPEFFDLIGSQSNPCPPSSHGH